MTTAASTALTPYSSATSQPSSEKKITVDLAWNSDNAALVELDDPPTLNAMTARLMLDLDA